MKLREATLKTAYISHDSGGVEEPHALHTSRHLDTGTMVHFGERGCDSQTEGHGSHYRYGDATAGIELWADTAVGYVRMHVTLLWASSTR